MRQHEFHIPSPTAKSTTVCDPTSSDLQAFKTRGILKQPVSTIFISSRKYTLVGSRVSLLSGQSSYYCIPAEQEDVLMAFDPEELDPTIDFTDVSKNDVKWVEGKGQWVYWKGCSGLTEYVNNGEGKVHDDMLSGQAKLQSGTELYIVGGKVKEG